MRHATKTQEANYDQVRVISISQSSQRMIVFKWTGSVAKGTWDKRR